jgi:hypothetical protein
VRLAVLLTRLGSAKRRQASMKLRYWPQPRVVAARPRNVSPFTGVARWQKFQPKSSKWAAEKKSWPKEFVAEFWLNLPKSGRKGAAENFQKKFLIFSYDNYE